MNPLDCENAAHLRDLYHSPAWEVYTRFARQRIEELMKEYLRDDLTREEICDRHTRLQAVTKFEAGMEELVRTAVDFVAPENIRAMIMSHQIDPDL